MDWPHRRRVPLALLLPEPKGQGSWATEEGREGRAPCTREGETGPGSRELHSHCGPRSVCDPTLAPVHSPRHRDLRHPGFRGAARAESSPCGFVLIPRSPWRCLICCCESVPYSCITVVLTEAGKGQVTWLRSLGREMTVRPGLELAGCESFAVAGPRLSPADRGSEVPKLRGQGQVSSHSGLILHRVSLTVLPPSPGPGRKSQVMCIRSSGHGAAHSGISLWTEVLPALPSQPPETPGAAD